jgi:hypothetical protein
MSTEYFSPDALSFLSSAVSSFSDADLKSSLYCTFAFDFVVTAFEEEQPKTTTTNNIDNTIENVFFMVIFFKTIHRNIWMPIKIRFTCSFTLTFKIYITKRLSIKNGKPCKI